MDTLAVSSKKRVFLIINPFSGTRRARLGLFTVVDVLCSAGALVTVQTTQHRGHATQLAHDAALQGYDVIACCGGDGTLNETVSGILSSGADVPLGYVPAGSTNDFATSMGIPSDFRAAALGIVNGTPERIDIGRWSDRRYFTYIASFGAFTAASYNAAQPAKNAIGHLAYLLEGVKDLQSLRPNHIRAVSGGKVYEGDYIFGAVSSSTSVGGIVKLEHAGVRFDDGLFEVILVRSPNNIVEFSQIVQAIQSSNYTGKMFDFFHASEVTFDMFKPVAWSLDGERADSGRYVAIRNLHRALTLMRLHD